MMRRPEVSFIIPARNEGAALQATLQHLQNAGTGGNYETILVDDMSTPPLNVSCRIPHSVRYHRCETRHGVARARNVGASLAAGEILFFLDAHVCFSESSIAEILQSGPDRGIRGCTTRLIHNFEQFVELARGSPTEVVAPSEQYYGWRIALDDAPDVTVIRDRKACTPFPVPYVGACALAISRDLFLELGGFDDGLTGYGSLEDAELAMRTWAFGKDVKVVPQAVCYHFSEQRSEQTPDHRRVHDPLDHHRYDGSFHNSLRVMCLHFPSSAFIEIVGKLNQQRRKQGLLEIEPQALSAELKERTEWIEARRVRSREWLIDWLTHA